MQKWTDAEYLSMQNIFYAHALPKLALMSLKALQSLTYLRLKTMILKDKY